MAFVSITRLRIRKWRFMPGFVVHALRSNRQVRGSAGFRGGSLLADRRRTFWTMTVWDDAAAMRAYITGGAHRVAMPRLLDWCDEASIAHWDMPGDVSNDALPDWAEADRRMRGEGRISKVRHPSPDHAGMTFAPPRATLAQPLRPRR